MSQNNEGHIIASMLKAREDAQVSYGPHYRKNVFPFKKYILDQMEEQNVSSHIEMAVMMLQDAENEDDPDLLIMNILAGCMEIEDPT